MSLVDLDSENGLASWTSFEAHEFFNIFAQREKGIVPLFELLEKKVVSVLYDDLSAFEEIELWGIAFYYGA